MSKIRLFISYDYDKDRHYKNLFTAWDKHNLFDFKFYDASVDISEKGSKVDNLKRLIRSRINDAKYFLCIVGEETYKSKRVDWEITIALQLEKQIIVVKINKNYIPPPAILREGSIWAKSFTFNSVKNAMSEKPDSPKNVEIEKQELGLLDKLIKDHYKLLVDHFLKQRQMAQEIDETENIVQWNYYSNLQRDYFRNLQPEKVLLGLSAPQVVKPKEEFTARFTAYIESFEREIEEKLKELSPRSQFVSQIKKCQWQIGTKVTVKCYGTLFEVNPEEDPFIWNGNFNIVEFDVTVSPKVQNKVAVLKFDVLIDEFVVARLRIDVEINQNKAIDKRKTVKSAPYSTAFASYSSEDRPRVLDRVSEIRAKNGNLD